MAGAHCLPGKAIQMLAIQGLSRQTNYFVYKKQPLHPDSETIWHSCLQATQVSSASMQADGTRCICIINWLWQQELDILNVCCHQSCKV